MKDEDLVSEEDTEFLLNLNGVFRTTMADKNSKLVYIKKIFWCTLLS